MSLGDYILGLVGLAAIAISLAIAARTARRALVPGWTGSPALLADAILAIGLLVILSELLGLAGLLTGPLLVAASLITAGAALRLARTLPDAGAGTPGPRPPTAEIAIALAIAFLVALQWAGPTLTSLDRGMYGGDSLWYHMPFAAHIAQTGSVTELLYTDPLYLNWFYPQNSELLHADALLLLGNDFLSPLLNLAWLGLALLAGWCCGRPHGAAPATLAGVAALMSANLMFSRQPGLANNDVVAIALFLSSVAILLNARWDGLAGRGAVGGAAAAAARGIPAGALALAGLAAGLALGTKLTIVVPVAALSVAVVILASAGTRLRAAAVWGGAILAGGGYWYARNLIVSGNPLPWVDLGIFPKAEELEGRDPFTVAHYLTDTDVWGRWFVPGLEERFGDLWPLILALAVAGVAVALRSGRPVERMLGAVAAVAAVAYLLTPLGAAGPEGSPVAFRLNLRYLAPALGLAFVLLAIPPGFLRARARLWTWGAIALFAAVVLIGNGTLGEIDDSRPLGGLLLAAAAIGLPVAVVLLLRRGIPTPAVAAGAVAAVLAVCALGREAQTEYLDLRYSTAAADYPADEHPSVELGQGIGAAFDWARGEEDVRIALSGSLAGLFQYGLWGPDSSNEVRFLGERGERGTFTVISDCPEYLTALNGEDFDYLVTSPGYEQDDPEANVAPVERDWIARAGAAERVAGGELVDVWRLDGPVDPAICAR